MTDQTNVDVRVLGNRYGIARWIHSCSRRWSSRHKPVLRFWKTRVETDLSHYLGIKRSDFQGDVEGTRGYTSLKCAGFAKFAIAKESDESTLNVLQGPCKRVSNQAL